MNEKHKLGIYYNNKKRDVSERHDDDVAGSVE